MYNGLKLMYYPELILLVAIRIESISIFSYLTRASKLIAEYLLQQAKDKYCIPIVIVRPGTISGDSETGAANLSQFLSRFDSF